MERTTERRWGWAGVGGRERVERLEGEVREEAEQDGERALGDGEMGEREQAAEEGERREGRGVGEQEVRR